MKSIATINFKGGVGKTTVTWTLANVVAQDPSKTSLIREELEAMSADDLRRLADANNLNVTLKNPKDRVVQLLGFRFRVKKQLRPPTRP